MSQITRTRAFIHDDENSANNNAITSAKIHISLKHANLQIYSTVLFLAKGNFFLIIISEFPRCFNGRWFYIRKSLGSVTYPVKAEAAAVYGDAR
jgi:hypothetical protein